MKRPVFTGAAVAIITPMNTVKPKPSVHSATCRRRRRRRDMRSPSLRLPTMVSTATLTAKGSVTWLISVVMEPAAAITAG